MATIKNSPFGIIRGKVGNLIGYDKNGAQAFRTCSKKIAKPATVAQQAQRMRFGMMVSFLAPLKSLTSKGYGNRKGTKSQSAQCMAYNTRQAVKGVFPELEINYPKILITTGRLCSAAYAEAFSDRAGCINFSWEEGARSWMDGATDNAIPVVYNPSKDRHLFLRTSSDRASQSTSLDVPLYFSGDTVHCWLVFISDNGKEFSTSQYLGTVTVA